MLGRFVGRVRVDHAARGVGKTSLLREAQRIFERRGVATVWVTANEDEKLLPTILAELKSALPPTRRKTARQGVHQRRKDGAGSLAEAGAKGLVILVDEVQSADKQSLRAIAHGWQELESDLDAPPAGLFTVGLPGSVDHLISAVTFSERFDFEPLLGIDEAGSAEALVSPAQTLDVVWEPTALRAAVIAADGYPFKVQLMGEAAWEAAGEPEPGGRITSMNVEKPSLWWQR